MVVTKHFATHGKKYRRRLIKYFLVCLTVDNILDSNILVFHSE